MKGEEKIQALELPPARPCSFVWSLQTLLAARGFEIPSFEIEGSSLNAFAVWAHPHQSVRLWAERFSDLFVEILLRSLGMRGEILKVPPKELDLIGHFIEHWGARIETSLNVGVPVASCGTWDESAWGIITSWDRETRVLKGFIPGTKAELENTGWPDKIFILAGSTIKPDVDENIKLVLEKLLALGNNKYSQDGWVSGADAYVLWQRRIQGQYSKEHLEHQSYAEYLSHARREASSYLTHYAGTFGADIERLLLSAARRYHRSAIYLHDASQALAERPFLAAINEALGEDEKALVLVEEVLFHIE